MYVEAEHFCTQARGVREASSRTGTLLTHGVYNQDPHLPEEFRLLREASCGSCNRLTWIWN